MHFTFAGHGDPAVFWVHRLRHTPSMQALPGAQLSGFKVHDSPTLRLCRVWQSQTVLASLGTPVSPARKTQEKPDLRDTHSAKPVGLHDLMGGEQRNTQLVAAPLLSTTGTAVQLDSCGQSLFVRHIR